MLFKCNTCGGPLEKKDKNTYVCSQCGARRITCDDNIINDESAPPKSKIAHKVKKMLQFLFNPKLLLSLAIGWIITNGWSYVFLAVGTLFDISWMLYIGGAYLAFLWVLPTPEKIITVVIAIFLLKKLFPNDTKTLAVLLDMQKKIKEKITEVKAKRAEKKERRKQEKEEKIRQKSANS